MRSIKSIQSFVLLVITLAGYGRLHATDWLQFGIDAVHSGNNTSEQGYSTATGNRLAFSVSLPTVIDSAPVFLSSIATSGGIKDLLFVESSNGSLLALNAASGTVVWSRQTSGTAAATTSTPVIDPARQYVYAYGLDGKVHKYKVDDGSEISADGWPQLVTRKPNVDKVASALSIGITTAGAEHLYAVTASFVDVGDYQGHLTTIDLATGTQRLFNAQCSDLTDYFVENGITSGANQNDCVSTSGAPMSQRANSGIWGRAGAAFDAATNRVYVATGNGAFDPTNILGNGIDWGDSVLALNPDGTGTGTQGMPIDSYTPTTFAGLLATDADLGVTSLAILPAPASSKVAHLGVQGGKDGCVRLLDLDLLSGTPGAGHVGGELQAINLPNTSYHCGDGQNIGVFKTQASVWVNPADASTWTFIASGVGVVAYQVIVDMSGNPSLSQQWTAAVGSSPSVIANGTLYFVTSRKVQALDALTGSSIWNDTRPASIHWQSPILVNGRLYVIDSTSTLWVYQLDGIFRSGF